MIKEVFSYPDLSVLTNLCMITDFMAFRSGGVEITRQRKLDNVPKYAILSRKMARKNDSINT
jgi:hypothetical protein